MLRSETEATVASTVPPSTYGPSVNTDAFTFAISNDGAETPVMVHESTLRVPLVPDARSIVIHSLSDVLPSDNPSSFKVDNLIPSARFIFNVCDGSSGVSMSGYNAWPTVFGSA